MLIQKKLSSNTTPPITKTVKNLLLKKNKLQHFNNIKKRFYFRIDLYLFYHGYGRC